MTSGGHKTARFRGRLVRGQIGGSALVRAREAGCKPALPLESAH